MIRDIVHDPILLSVPSTPATAEDLPVCQDLRDTLAAHRDSCVGMAANMIGVPKKIIIFDDHGVDRVFLNPTILRQEGPYQTEEGCLSLAGVRRCRRYRKIKVQYQNEKLETRMGTFSDWTAQIIQHEIDHCMGILI